MFHQAIKGFDLDRGPANPYVYAQVFIVFIYVYLVKQLYVGT